MSYLDVTCPKCGQSYYSINYTTSTLMFCPTIVKDGQVVSSNPNYTTYNCQCIACGARFNVTEHNDRVENVEVIEGFAPASELPYETLNITAGEASTWASENVKLWAKAAEESYQERVSNIKQEIANLEFELNSNSIKTSELPMECMRNGQYPVD